MEQDNFKRCPCYCGDPAHATEKDKSYCQLHVWHAKVTTLLEINQTKGIISTDGHYYDCKHTIPNQGFHFVLCLDESYSMEGSKWLELTEAVKNFCNTRKNSKKDRLSIVQFESCAKTMCNQIEFSSFDETKYLLYGGGRTDFGVAISHCHKLIGDTVCNNIEPVFVFMSDGECRNGDSEMKKLWTEFGTKGLKVFTIAFGKKSEKLNKLADFGHGKYLLSIDGLKLKEAFQEITSNFGTRVGIIYSKI